MNGIEFFYTVGNRYEVSVCQINSRQLNMYQTIYTQLPYQFSALEEFRENFRNFAGKTLAKFRDMKIKISDVLSRGEI